MAKSRANHVPSANRPPPNGDGNLLLAVLPAADYARIVPPLEVVPLRLKDILHQPGKAIRDIYFPSDGFCSELTVLADGRMVEVATIGREGAVGLLGDAGYGPVASATMVQGATSTSVKMPIEAFRHEMERHGPFFDVVSSYRRALVRFIMQSTACNAVHTVEERLARWLLTAQDHLRANAFPLTQESVAMMLGVTRPTVSEVAATLQRAGLITYRRGQVTVVDRERLEAAACECYAITAAIVESLTPNSRRGPGERTDSHRRRRFGLHSLVPAALLSSTRSSSREARSFCRAPQEQSVDFRVAERDAVSFLSRAFPSQTRVSGDPTWTFNYSRTQIKPSRRSSGL